MGIVPEIIYGTIRDIFTLDNISHSHCLKPWHNNGNCVHVEAAYVLQVQAESEQKMARLVYAIPVPVILSVLLCSGQITTFMYIVLHKNVIMERFEISKLRQ